MMEIRITWQLQTCTGLTLVPFGKVLSVSRNIYKSPKLCNNTLIRLFTGSCKQKILLPSLQIQMCIVETHNLKNMPQLTERANNHSYQFILNLEKNCFHKLLQLLFNPIHKNHNYLTTERARTRKKLNISLTNITACNSIC